MLITPLIVRVTKALIELPLVMFLFPVFYVASVQSNLFQVDYVLSPDEAVVLFRAGLCCAFVFTIAMTFHPFMVRGRYFWLIYIIMFATLTLLKLFDGGLTIYAVLINAALGFSFSQAATLLQLRNRLVVTFLIFSVVVCLLQLVIVFAEFDLLTWPSTIFKLDEYYNTFYVPSFECYRWLGCINLDPNAINLMGLGRLQGWAYEPLHWASFVLLGVSTCLCVRNQLITRHHLYLYYTAMVIFGANLVAVDSLMAWIIIVAALIATTFRWIVQHISKNNLNTVPFHLFIFIIFPLIFVPNLFFSSETLLTELIIQNSGSDSSNWNSKLTFLQADYWRLFNLLPPALETQSSVGHNLFLNTLGKFGLLAIVPLVVFFSLCSKHLSSYSIDHSGYLGRTLFILQIILGIDYASIGPLFALFFFTFFSDHFQRKMKSANQSH